MATKKPDNLAGDKRFERLKQKAAQAEAAALKKNIYKRGVFEKLVEVDAEVFRIANSTEKQYRDVLTEAGIQHPYDVLVQSMNHWDKMLAPSKLPSEEQLVEDLRQNFQLNVARAADVFVPPEEELPVKNGDSKDSQEKGDDVNKVALALEALLHMKLGGEQLAIEDMDVVVGRTPEHGWRTRPYWIITLKKHKIAVFVNNQYANRTFVIGYKDHEDLEIFKGYTKEQLKKLREKNIMMHHFIYTDAGQFKAELYAAMQKVFEGKEMLKAYPTYEEASAAVKKLAITSLSDYKNKHREDPRLPSNPDKKYKHKGWKRWADFIGTANVSGIERGQQVYQTYEEAKVAVSEIVPKIESMTQYMQRYKEDPRLSSNPQKKYKDNGWKSWIDFLGTENVSNFERSQQMYQAYEEAREAVKQLGITSQADYRVRYREDPRLPSTPDRKYANKGWKGWSHFLGKE